MPDENLDAPDDSEHLDIPFVTVKSNGGPHDDDAYSAGFEVGQLVHDLAILSLIASAPGDRLEFSRHILSENLPQIDLAAMSDGFTVTVERAQTCEDHEDSDEWCLATFVKESE